MYELILTSNAKRDMRRLAPKIQKQVLNKLERLCENCDEYPHKALKGNYKGQFKLPCGHYKFSILTINRPQQLKSPEFSIVHPSMKGFKIPLTPKKQKDTPTPQRIPRTHP